MVGGVEFKLHRFSDCQKIEDKFNGIMVQCFVSLTVYFDAIIVYASYNKFDHNVYRDATIITGLDTFTSLLAGCTIFGITGHLAHEIGTDDIGSVVKGGAGLAFISYPKAIAKFQSLPKIFSVLFFIMLFILGVGSNMGIVSRKGAAIKDNFGVRLLNWFTRVYNASKEFFSRLHDSRSETLGKIVALELYF
uniref:Sodium-dependent nutrient amino acid transporter 1 n=1 Tax=Glossina austeni TaxID=7395 RepID=A0A1A9VQ62_GLOAU